jgi:hypothetical protein
MLENKGIRSFLLRMVTYKVFELGLFGGSIVQRKFGIGIYIETEKKIKQTLSITTRDKFKISIFPNIALHDKRQSDDNQRRLFRQHRKCR